MSKKFAFLFCFIVGQNLFAKSPTRFLNRDVMLIDSLELVPACGDVIFSVAAKFIAYSPEGLLNKKDTIVFYIVCPEGYGDNFWNKGASYKVKYEEFNKKIRYSYIVYKKMKNRSFSPAQNKYLNVGVIKEARKRTKLE